MKYRCNNVIMNKVYKHMHTWSCCNEASEIVSSQNTCCKYKELCLLNLHIYICIYIYIYGVIYIYICGSEW